MEEEGSFTFEWRVKNFSMCPAEYGSVISSPEISVKMFGNSEWTLQFYPKGCKLQGFMSCYLKCISAGIYKTVQTEYSISVFPQSITEDNSCPHDFEQGRRWGFHLLISIDDILKEKDEYLPNDTLTLKCIIRCKNLSKNPEDEIFEAFSRECIPRKYSLNMNKCSIETVIPIQTKSILWPIRNFRSLPINKRITIPMFTAMKETPSFYVTLFKTAESPTHIEIKRKKDDSSENIFARCNVSVSNAPKDINCSAEDEFLFKSDNVWNFPPLQNWKKLDDGYFKHTGDVLYLRFQFSFSIDGKMHHSERYDRDPDVFLPSERQIPVDVLTTPSTDDELSVVSLRSGDQSFKVHKSVLKASSEVFGAMFENNMKEKVTGVVDIPDVDPQTLGRMVAFFYSGNAGELSTTDCKKLYAVTHKYQVQSLMNHCSSFLLSSLTASNVCDILSLADLYRNDRLLKSAEAFIITNSDRILVSPDWKNLMENNPSLAAKVMYKMLIK